MNFVNFSKVSFSLFSVGLILSISVIAGCNTMLDTFLPVQDRKAGFAKEEQHREQFIETRKPADIRWLLKNSVKNGMSKADVDRVMGEDGEREFNDSNLLANEGLYRADDKIYRWGPDRDGNSYMLVFRDGHLINFENFSEEWDQ
ncbi:MAG TPA: hypothetical protein DD473_16655 [Planctomycetaceae bacterium]|nr:hypothetical protein [Planctomycetaceae bacterium]|tara:strand:- start:804 stop:1238 length:435 start_codon:yes stop_codon:yes gene_type:complete